MTRLRAFPFVLCVLAAAAGCSRKTESASAAPQAQKQPVEVTSVVRRDLAETLTVVGSIAANESAALRAEIAGQVREVFFDEGQRVTKGQVLLKIDDSELRAQFAQAESRFKLAELSLARNQGLLETKTVSQADFDRANAEFSTATAELSLLRVRLAKTEIKAPFDGVVGGRSISPGDYVTPASVIAQIDDLSRLKIDFQIPERFIGKIKQGTSFTLRSRTLDASARVQGEVYFVSSVIDRATRASEVKGLLVEPPAGLKPGMFANVEIVLDVRKDALTVPEGSILASVRGAQLIAVKDSGSDKIAEFIPVELGLRARGFVEIVSSKTPLDEQQSIVAAGVGSLILFPGAKLDPKPLKAEIKKAE
ncbi:efflux RND transporter periplasmic adaptor subunit [Nibricoccus aquaticus]|nr:efflux RND transporter periplasmic adaptor subunit [Nibricoccus aquaticus]